MVVARTPILMAWIILLAGCVNSGLFREIPPPSHDRVVSNSVAKYPGDPDLPGVIEYINPDVVELRDPDYPGHYYEAIVPATLDLAERARLATHALTSMTNPKMDHEIFFTVSHMTRPPAMDHNASDLHCHGKFMEVLPLMRVMSGSLENMHVEKKWMEVLLKMQGPDGLIYSPTTGRDWILPPNQDVASGSPGSDTFKEKHFCLLGFSTARSMAVLSLYAKKDPGGPWAEAAGRLASAYGRLMINEGDRSHLFSTWMYPGREVVPPESHPFDEYGYLAGTQAWIAQYLAVYDRALDDPAASQLAERIMNYNMFEIEYNEPDGRFKPSKGVGAGPLREKNQYAHFHTHAMNILACIYVYMQTGNERLLERAVKAYEWGISRGNSRVGFFPMCTYDEYIGAQTAETCQVADMLIAGVTLARLGHDTWDDVDRWVRNQFAESQLTRVNWLRDGHLDYSRSPVGEGYFDSPRRTTEQVADRTLGAFAGWPSPNDWVGAEDWWGGDSHNIIYTIMNCCTGSGCRGLYSVWRDMISFEKDTLRVHLLLNRASGWADIDSYIPFTGRVDVKVKQDLKLALRIPEWVVPDAVTCTVDGKPRGLSFDGRYAQVGNVAEGEKVIMTFPISERTEKHTIEGFDYTFTFRGNDVVYVDPPGKYAPMYQRGHYRAGKPVYRKVTRFVSDEVFPWW